MGPGDDHGDGDDGDDDSDGDDVDDARLAAILHHICYTIMIIAS